MTPKAKAKALEALQSELGEATDNLRRAELQRAANPGWRDGNGTPIAKVVRDYRKQRDELRYALQQLRG